MATNRKQVLSLCAMTVGMFGFGYALVPLYDVFCDITGLNGKTGGQALYETSTQIDKSRTVTIEFIARINRGMPWEFEPKVERVTVHPGELKMVNFFVRNRSAEAVTAQAVPSVAPGIAANYLHKTECFCFNQQQLAGGKAMDMPLQFYIDPDIPSDINTLTLSYTLYNVTPENDVKSAYVH